MDWNLDSSRSIWLQLKHCLTVGIITGEYPPGSRLPSVRELAAQAGVNPNTMQRALTELERDGLAQSQGTVGRVVTQDAEILRQVRQEFAQEQIQQYLTGMEALGFSHKEAYLALEEHI